jgi:hypothetical protein
MNDHKFVDTIFNAFITELKQQESYNGMSFENVKQKPNITGIGCTFKLEYIYSFLGSFNTCDSTLNICLPLPRPVRFPMIDMDKFESINTFIKEWIPAGTYYDTDVNYSHENQILELKYISDSVTVVVTFDLSLGSLNE